MVMAVGGWFKATAPQLPAAQPPHLPWGLSYALEKLLK